MLAFICRCTRRWMRDEIMRGERMASPQSQLKMKKSYAYFGDKRRAQTSTSSVPTWFHLICMIILLMTWKSSNRHPQYGVRISCKMWCNPLQCGVDLPRFVRFWRDQCRKLSVIGIGSRARFVEPSIRCNRFSCLLQGYLLVMLHVLIVCFYFHTSQFVWRCVSCIRLEENPFDAQAKTRGRLSLFVFNRTHTT